MFENFSTSVKDTKSGQNISDLLFPDEGNGGVDTNQVEPTVGAVAPDFEAPTPEGVNLSLQQVKGKLTVIDFWASWCKPCRVQSDRLVAMHQLFQSEGLNMISVSLDRDADKWIEAIKDDNLDWHHVSNLAYWNEPIARAYNVDAIPELFLLDEKGIVMYRGRDVMDLTKTIEEALSRS